MGVFAKNQYKPTQTIQVVLTADNDAGTAALSHAPILNGCGIGYGGLPAGVTAAITNGVTYAQLQDMLQKRVIRIKKLTVRTANQAEVFSSYMQRGEILANGDIPSPEKLYLDGYATRSNGSYDDTLFIEDKITLVRPWDFLTVPVKKAGATTVLIEYDFEQDSVNIPTEQPVIAN